jgi:hypothetical protein
MQEKVYISFQGTIPKIRSDINYTFNLTCPSGSTNVYKKGEVNAEMGNSSLAGAAIGGLLFLLDPVLGILGAVLGGTISASAEKDSVDKFNNS